ncbi:MAG: ADP-forming succinate--CoA ligase subunit beta [Planctomycetes bacterium]|nr:ADP-forming succinate--CoA ligase subunit beta [Planctomycetota bacterium]
MNIHEYQAKQLFRRFGIPILQGEVAETADQAQAAAKKLGTPVVVVKSQVLAGGRGKGRFKEHGPSGPGGVVVVKDLDKVRATADAILGSTLVTIQTGDKGEAVHKVYVEAGCAIEKEFYAAVTLDREHRGPTLMASAEGGMDIEEVAATHPEKIFRQPCDPLLGLLPFQARDMARRLGLKGESLKQGADLLERLVRLFIDSDCSIVEVNPLVTTKDGQVLALDAKITFDDNGLPRHPDFAELRDPNAESPEERAAREHDLSYISLDGDIGCMVNGAGLAMATMDMIKHAGGAPANFLDVGGGASEDRIKAAFKIIVSDEDVKAILVNIFGGILRCDLLASGVVAAARSLELRVPIVVRLEGTNVEQGKKIIEESGLKVTFAPDLAQAATKVVAAARGEA